MPIVIFLTFQCKIVIFLTLKGKKGIFMTYQGKLETNRDFLKIKEKISGKKKQDLDPFIYD